MCGVVGYTGHREACPILLNGLKRLEYRGYDSAGLAIIDPDREIKIFKAKGKVADLECYIQGKPMGGLTVIAHTRWATHGEPNHANAHPHDSFSGRIALIHNGIIENYSPLRQMLLQKGYVFKSTTDSEVLVQLIEFIMESEGVGLLSAVQAALGRVLGSYAIAVIDREIPKPLFPPERAAPL